MFSQNMHTKKQENMTHKKEEKSKETDPELTQILEIADKGITTVVLTLFHISKIKYQCGISII